MATAFLYVDGASRGNPGPASIGVSLQNEAGEETDCIAQTLGLTTNNEAEYRALIEGLKLALKRDVKNIEVRSDSELLVRQMIGQYKVKHENLKRLWAEAKELSLQFKSFAIQHVRRENNQRADELANQALDDLT